MATEFHALNPAGREQYRDWLERLRVDPALPVPTSLLGDPAFSFLPVPGLTVPEETFPTKYELARTLLPLVKKIEETRLSEGRWPGVWDGLALRYFDQICPPAGFGKRSVGEIERYTWDSRHTRFYKHRISGPITLYRAHREAAVVFLCGAPTILSDYEIQLCSRQEWMTCEAIGRVCCALYWDESCLKTRRGGMSKTAPGALFHFVKVLQHLERTYDLQGISCEGLLKLLPRNFEIWLNRN